MHTSPCNLFTAQRREFRVWLCVDLLGLNRRGGRCQSTHKHEVPKLAREALRELELQAEGQSDEYRASTLEAEPDGRAAAGAPLSASPAVGFLGRRINLTLRSFS
jgi:hypothetical protein